MTCVRLQCRVGQFHCPKSLVFPPFVPPADPWKLWSFQTAFLHTEIRIEGPSLSSMLDGSCIFSAEYYTTVWRTPILFSHSLLKDISCLQVLTIMNTSVISVSAGFCVDMDQTLGCIAGLYSKNEFSFLRNQQTVSQSDLCRFTFYQHWTRVPVAP